MNFKANIVKLNKCIVYQPVYVDEQLKQKAKKYSDLLYFNVSTQIAGNLLPNKFGVYYRSNPTLDRNYILLGFDYCNSGYSSTIKFESNEERDIYYERLMKAIKLGMEKLEKDRETETYNDFF